MPEDPFPVAFDEGSQQFSLDSMNTSFYALKCTIDRHVLALEEKSNLLKGDLIDSLELFESHYTQTSKQQCAEAQEIWDQVHLQRTEMLWSKEEYIEFMHAYSKMKARVVEVQA